MARYIDAEALTAEFKRLTLGENSLIERIFADGVYAVIDTFPAVDVVPRERYDRVMDNLKAVLAERAEEKSEVAREIFAEIRKIVTAIYNKHIFGSVLEDEEKEAVMDFEVDISSAFDELKKKYTEGNK